MCQNIAFRKLLRLWGPSDGECVGEIWAQNNSLARRASSAADSFDQYPWPGSHTHEEKVSTTVYCGRIQRQRKAQADVLEAQEGLQDRLLITIHLAVLWMAGCTEEAVCTRGLLRPASARRPPGNTCTRQPLWEPTPVSSYLEISEAESIGWDQTPLQWAMWICHLCNQNLGRHSTSFGKWLHVTSWALQLWTVPLRLPSLRMQEWSLDMKGQFPQHSLWRAVRTMLYFKKGTVMPSVPVLWQWCSSARLIQAGHGQLTQNYTLSCKTNMQLLNAFLLLHMLWEYCA